MNRAKVFIFAPSDPAGESHRKIEGQGCELFLGKASWGTPQGDNEAEMAEGVYAVVGTSIRSSSIYKRWKDRLKQTDKQSSLKISLQYRAF